MTLTVFGLDKKAQSEAILTIDNYSYGNVRVYFRTIPTEERHSTMSSAENATVFPIVMTELIDKCRLLQLLS